MSTPGVDLRLVPSVLAAAVTAWLVTGPARAVAPVAALVGVAVLVVLGALALAYGRSRARDTAGTGAPGPGVVAHALLAAVCVVAVCAGAAVQTDRQAPLAEAASDGALAHLTGRVVSEPRPAVFGGGRRWVLAVGSVTVRGATAGTTGQVEVTATGPAPRFGAVVEVSGVLRAAPSGDGVLARTTSGPVAERESPGALLRGTHVLRAALLDVTEPLSPQARGLVPGVAVGDTSRLPPDLDEAMRTTSLTHVTAVSGGHFAIVVATLTALCALLRAPRWVRVVAVGAVALGFVALVRPEPSVLRAAWTCAFALLGLALGRPSAGLPALAGAATVLLVVDPWLARSYGFVLSCAATAGLVLLAGPLARRLAPWTGRPLAFGLAVPWAAQAACGPVLVLLDPRVPLTSVPANLLAAPALVPATVLGLVATLLAPWLPGAAHAVAWLAGVGTAWIAAVARGFAGLPGAALPWPGGVGGALALGLVTAALLAVVLRRSPRHGWP
ncbi:ComEC/Rec2 family competence protein, partial [Isoptericola cucumis]|uniref:ComEC/Rec2 family competence protein n=1 Tax=Isoptericola cucumis TaxID=1776856 RepID=UPI003209EC29